MVHLEQQVNRKWKLGIDLSLRLQKLYSDGFLGYLFGTGGGQWL